VPFSVAAISDADEAVVPGEINHGDAHIFTRQNDNAADPAGGPEREAVAWPRP
jgi:hypothetical protein